MTFCVWEPLVEFCFYSTFLHPDPFLDGNEVCAYLGVVFVCFLSSCVCVCVVVCGWAGSSGLDMFGDALWADGSQQLPYRFTEWRGGGREGPRQECEAFGWFSLCHVLEEWLYLYQSVYRPVHIFFSGSQCLPFYIHVRWSWGNQWGSIMKWNDKVTFEKLNLILKGPLDSHSVFL